MFAPGQRVKWRHPEPGVNPASLVGKTIDRGSEDDEYVVRWDDGTEEWVNEGDIVAEEE